MIDIIYIENREQLSIENTIFIEELIGETERNKAKRYRRWQDKQAYLLGKLLIAVFLKKYKFDYTLLKKLSYTQFKRPYIESVKADFNISHSGELVVCAFSLHQKVGIDVERIQEVNFDDFRYILNKADEEAIKNAEEKYVSFFKIWSAKEAILKAEGCGLIDNLDKLEISGEKGCFNKATYYLHELNIHPGYSSCVASSSSIINLKVEKVFVKDLLCFFN